MSRYHIVLKAFNVLAYALVIAVNFFGLIDYPDKDDRTLITPARWAFQIWLVIYGLLGGFVIYQWFPAESDAIADGVWWYHVIGSILNVSWLAAWRNDDLVVLNAFILLSLFATNVRIYKNLELYPAKGIFDWLFLHKPFAIYTAWTGVAMLVNFWLAFPILDENWPSTFAVAGIGLVGIHFVDYYHRHDVTFSATILWALVSIAAQHQDVLPILIASCAGAGLIIGGIFRVWVHNIAVWWRLRNANLDERAPLLGPV